MPIFQAVPVGWRPPKLPIFAARDCPSDRPSAGPPTELGAPPACAHDRAWVLRALWNNATATLAAQGKWTNRGANVDRFNSYPLRDHPLRRNSSAAAARLLGTGPWTVVGAARDRGQAFRIDRLYVMANGWLISRKGHGRWGLRKRSGGGWDDDVVVFTICGAQEVALRPTFGESQWTLTSADGNASRASGTLDAPPEALRAWQVPLVAPASVLLPLTPAGGLSLRIEGTGGYRGAAWRGELFFLRAGVLRADGTPSLPYSGGGRRAQTLNRWVALDAKRVALGSTQDDDDASRQGYVAGLHVAFLDCYALRFVSPPAGPSSGGELPPLPPKYALASEAESLEWVIRPKASSCVDPCAGLTLRALTAEDRAASPLAQKLEACALPSCGLAWHGHAGLVFGPGGTLKTPWGSGVWGAPPDGQAGDRPAIYAEFAGQQHALRAQLNRQREVTAFESRRCSDNDAATITVTAGKIAV